MIELNITVDYYNEVEKKAFSEYSNATEIQKFIGTNIAISKDELLTYMMFNQQDDRDGWRNYNDLSQKVTGTLGHVEEYLDFSDNNAKSKVNSEVLNEAHFTERVGVAMGLCLLNKIHNLTEADWNKTKKRYDEGKRQKDLDFEFDIASDGSRFIQVENKGVVNDDNSKKTSGVSSKYTDIQAKKKKIKKDDEKNNLHNNIYYGTIAVLDQTNSAKILLVDPPADIFDINPEKFRLLNRLNFYHDLFNQIGISQKLLNLLKKRIKEIEFSQNYYVFNNVPINDFEFYLTSFEDIKNLIVLQQNQNYFVGNHYFDNETRLAFQVVPFDLIKIIFNQSFERILSYSFNINDRDDETLNISIQSDNTRFRGFDQIDENLYRFNGQILHSTSGRLFGLI